MAHVTLAPFIKSISGKVGNLEFRTLRSGKTVVRTRTSLISDAPRRRPSAEEKARHRRFGIISKVAAIIQCNDYARIDQAAADRKKIWERLSYAYNRLLKAAPTLSDEEIRKILLTNYRDSFSTPNRGFRGV